MEIQLEYWHIIMCSVQEGSRSLSMLPSSIWCYSVTPAPKFLDQPLLTLLYRGFHCIDTVNVHPIKDTLKEDMQACQVSLIISESHLFVPKLQSHALQILKIWPNLKIKMIIQLMAVYLFMGARGISF